MNKKFSVLEKQHHVQAWQTSGMTQRDYEKEHGLYCQSINKWSSQLKKKQQKLKNQQQSIVPLQIVPEELLSTNINPVSDERTGIQIKIKSYSIDISPNFSVSTLQEVVRVLEQC